MNLVCRNASYDIDADETRMIALQDDDASIPREMRVITNFFDVIRDRMASRWPLSAAAGSCVGQ